MNKTFETICKSCGIDSQLAPVPLIVKFKLKVFNSVVSTAVSAISKYHVVDKDNSTPVGEHSLVIMAKKLFDNKNLQSPDIVPYTIFLLF